MKKLIIHSGSHKTGSSSIQRFLFNKKSILSQSSIGVFNESGHSNFWLIPHFDNGVKIHIRENFHDRLAALQENVVVVSTENFSWMNNLKQIENWKLRLDRYFSEVEIVFYLRRQDKHAVSHHQQGSKDRRFIEHKFYGSEPRALPTYKPMFDDYFDYNQRIGQWADVFGDEAINIRIFDPSNFKEGNVVADFLEAVKFDIAPELYRDNTSNGRQFTLLSHLMVSNKVPHDLQKHIAASLDNTGKLTPSKPEMERFYSRYRESNIALNRRFKVSPIDSIFTEDFESYPQQSNEVLSHSESIDALNKIFTALSTYSVEK